MRVKGAERSSLHGVANDQNPLVSVIVPVYEDQGALSTLLSALDQQQGSISFECLVVDNGCRESVGALGGYGFSIRTLREERPGSYAARNRGIAEARGTYLAFTDADCIPEPGWLRASIARLESSRGLAVVGGRVESFVAPFAASVFSWHSAINDLDQRRFVQRYHFAATANLVAPARVFERVGSFDASLYSGADYEWGTRARAHGVAVLYDEAATVRHPARATWSALRTRTRRIAGGHHAVLQRRPLTVVRSAGLAVRIGLASQRRIWSDPRLPDAGTRLLVAGVEVALRAAHLTELLRLSLGGLPARR